LTQALAPPAVAYARARHAPRRLRAPLTIVVCVSFVGAGLLALRSQSYARFGVLLAAVGFSSLLGALQDTSAALPYTIGVLTANLVFAVLVHALLAFPNGRLGHGSSRLLALAAYVDVLVLQALAILFDPLTRWQGGHPRNLALVDSQAASRTPSAALSVTGRSRSPAGTLRAAIATRTACRSRSLLPATGA
jgi:hypothetical protein